MYSTCNIAHVILHTLRKQSAYYRVASWLVPQYKGLISIVGCITNLIIFSDLIHKGKSADISNSQCCLPIQDLHEVVGG